MSFNPETTYNQFMDLVNAICKLSPYQQMIQGPQAYNAFFENIYKAGFLEGAETAFIKNKKEIAKRN